MPRIHVCPLSRIESVARATGARAMITLISGDTPVHRPPDIAIDHHLVVPVHDIVAPLEGHVLPMRDHVLALLDFARRWDRATPLLIHCFAGVSRSTAAAYISAAALTPREPEDRLAHRLRAASPTATPNARLVALADEILGRGGRMIEAIRAIGRGRDCFEGEPFALDLAAAI